jgi:7-carboxy-7-deazaguanine synthase
LIRVNDIYGAIQGEGAKTGVPMVILRLQGCAVGCPFCDTKETWEVRDKDYVPRLADARGQNRSWTLIEPAEITAIIRAQYPTYEWVLITGGEPAEQDLVPLARALRGAGLRTALETSGTSDTHLGAGVDWVCVSPKINMPGGRDVIPDVVRTADEIRHVVGKPDDIKKLERLLEESGVTGDTVICLQPVSQNKQATELCAKTVQEKGWRLSVQVHKYLDLP